MSSPRKSRPPEDSILATTGQVLSRLLEIHGLDARDIGREAGVDFTRLPGPAERLSAESGAAVLRLAAEAIASPAFGLLAARCWHPSNLGVLGHAWLASSTLRTGLKRLERFWRLLGERGATTVQDVPQGLKVGHRRRRGDPALSAIAADIVMSVILDMCRMNAGAALRPVQVSLRRPKPADAEAYERFYGCAVRFGGEDNAFTLSPADADRALPSSNRQLAAVFDRLLAEELARLDKGDVVSRCRAAVLEQLESGELPEEEMAKRLHMSRRTLQRKLAEAETTYLRLVDDTRRDLALRYIEDPARSISDITFTLGFSQQSALTRAFRRWTGRSPSEHRALARSVK